MVALLRRTSWKIAAVLASVMAKLCYDPRFYITQAIKLYSDKSILCYKSISCNLYLDYL